MQTSTAAPYPDNAQRRLATKSDYALLISNGEERLDSCLRLTLHIFAASISRIGSIDCKLQRLKCIAQADGISFAADTHRIDCISFAADASPNECSANKQLGRGYPHVRTFNSAAS